MNFLHKKLWLAWSKFRFLRLPVEKRVRLEVTTDGRHLTFILVSLYEAGYGVQVYGGDWFFRELMLLRKTAPIPFLYGGKESECGISITDKSGFNHRGHGEHGGGKRILLDHDFFSGLATPRRQGSRSGDCRGQPEGARREGSSESTCPKRRETGKIIDSKIIETTEDMEVAAGLRLASQASAEFSNPFTIKLAQDSENTSPTRSANDPASSAEQPRTDIRGQNSSSPATSYPPLVTAPEVPLLDAGPSTLDSSAPVTSYSPPATALRAPYFMHPSVYHRGLHKRRSPITALDTRYALPVTRHSAEGASASHPLPVTSYPPQRRRRFRIGFFGTHDREFYTKHYHFPGMNRFEILEVFLQKFGNRMRRLRGFPRDWDPCEIAVSIDSKGGDRRGKFFLSQDHYFEALQECDFVLSPPGWCMPISHNLIESMFCGAIPITNGGALMAEPLRDGETCLEFQDGEGLVAVIESALGMDAGEVARMRKAVRDYYERFLDSKAFGETLVHSESGRVLVNAEENSVPLVFSRKFYSRKSQINS